MNITITQVRQKIIEAMKTIKIANGYSMDIPDDKILSLYSTSFWDNTRDDAYPKCFLYLTDQEHRDRPSYVVDRVALFAIVFALKEVNPLFSVQEQIEGLIEDFCKLTHKNKTLGGCATSVEVVELSTDGGVNHPEAVAVITLKVTYRHVYQ